MQLNSILCSALIVLFQATTFTWILADDWICWRGADRNGISREVGWIDEWPETEPKQLWKANLGTGFSSMVVAKGQLYSMGNSDDIDSVVCLDALSGKLLWSHSYPSPLDDRFFEGGPTSTPTLDGSNVFVFSRKGDVISLDAATGRVIWSKNLPDATGVDIPGWGFAGSPLVLGEQLILSAGQSGTALNKSTGEVLWTSSGEAGYMTPLSIQTKLGQSVIIASGKFFHGVDPVSGSVRWRQRWLTTFGCNAADPIFYRDRLFISSGYNRGSAVLELSSETPAIVWETKEFQNQWSSSVLEDGFVYGVDGNDTGDRTLKCLEFETGKIHWTFDGLGSASIMAANHRLIVLSDQGELVIAPASPVAFHPTARAKVLEGKCWTVPVLSNGLIYCRNASGELVCLDVRKR